MATLRLAQLTKTFPGGANAVDRIDLDVADGELLVLVGPSGCGKSTTMRLVAGLERPTAGTIAIGDRDVTALRPQDRDIAMVFQSYALYPHKTVRDNLAFGLRMRGVGKDDIATKVADAARILELEPLLDRKPRALSGGQRQRVALGRAIVRSPQIFLLDEPLSNLDARLRVQTRTELARLQRRLGATMLYVTHDQEEAMTLGDRVAVMRAGKIEQLAPPLDLYRHPATTFVAGFVGSPAMNLLACTIADGVARAGTLAIPVAAPPGPAILGVRPPDLDLVAVDRGDTRGRIDVIEALGRELLCHIHLDDATPDLRVLAPADADLDEGDVVGIALRRDRLHLFGEDGRRVMTPPR
ncbi:MAG TPA: sn-glycerol-3-phosphate ABC transporter ATP-binding protein UgpC [Kofleriaceae bacterium]|nr:sn-glycerol-3-phosphate ABC transporter ATP-binding protein UgpC [Kofleriaceae bacterium]